MSVSVAEEEDFPGVRADGFELQRLLEQPGQDESCHEHTRRQAGELVLPGLVPETVLQNATDHVVHDQREHHEHGTVAVLLAPVMQPQAAAGEVLDQRQDATRAPPSTSRCFDWGASFNRSPGD